MIGGYAGADRQSEAWGERLTRLSLAQGRLRYVIEGRPLNETTEAALEADCRAGAKAILGAVRRRRFENRSEGQRLQKLLRYESALWSAGVVRVAGRG